MDIENLWQMNKGFFLKVGAGLLVVLLCLYYSGDIRDQAYALSKENRSIENQIDDLKPDLEINEALTKGVRKRLSNYILPTIEGQAGWLPREEYLVEKTDQGGAFLFSERLEDLARKLRDGNRFNMKAPARLNFQESPKPGDERNWLLRLEVADRILEWLIDLKIQNIVEFKPGAIEYQTFEGRDQALRTIRFSLEFTSTLEQVEGFLTRNQRPGKTLEISHIVVEKADRRRNDRGSKKTVSQDPLSTRLIISAVTVVNADEAVGKTRVKPRSSGGSTHRTYIPPRRRR